MGEGRKDWRDSPAVDAVHLGASMAQIAAVVAVPLVVVVGIVVNQPVVGLAAALIVSLVLNVILVVVLQRKREVPEAESVKRIAVDGSDGEQKAVAKTVLALLRDSLDAAEWDNAHGQPESAGRARHAALTAVTEAEAIKDPTIRAMVRAYSEDLQRTRSGWTAQTGASAQDMDRLRGSHRDAVMAVGELLRG